MKNQWKYLNMTSKESEIVEAVNLIQEVFKMYTNLELKKIKSLIKTVNSVNDDNKLSEI